MVKKIIPGSTSSLTLVDHNETYGRHILANIAKKIKMNRCLDLGCGRGDDLSTISKVHPNAELHGIDFGNWNEQCLKDKKIKAISMNIENERMPFDDESFDFIIANQVMEHTKEIFWINHEIFRVLKTGGYFFLGVPNVLSLHNRLLMLMGHHPTQHKLSSAHVRPFSKKDVQNFYRDLGSSFAVMDGFWGSQFYPFPKSMARILSKCFPSLSFSIFFLIRKKGDYTNSFLEHPEKARLQTNFYVGPAE